MGAFDFDFLKNRGDDDGLVKNKKAGKISFKKSNGRIVVTNAGKKVSGSREVNDRLREMITEVREAEAGRTITTMKDLGAKGTEYKRHGIKSTFPKWFGSLGFNSKKDFNKVVQSKKGKRYERLVNKAIDDLSDGYETTFGKVPADKDFLVKSRQKFDNTGVIFRRINGKVVPLKVGRVRKFIEEEIPF